VVWKLRTRALIAPIIASRIAKSLSILDRVLQNPVTNNLPE
jgi:hypothetical protein